MAGYDVEKVINAIKFFKLKGVNYLGKTKLMKLLFFADKEHLTRYGIPIFYDKYFKLPHGPIPTLTLNIIDSLNEVENYDLEEYAKLFKEHLELKVSSFKGYTINEFEIKKDIDLDVFSESEIEVLKIIASKYKNHTATQLSELSHNLPEYQNTPLNEMIDYKKIAPNQKEYIEFIEKQNQELEELFE